MAGRLDSYQRLSDSDLEFLVGEVAPHVSNSQGMMRAIRQNEDLRAAVAGDDRVFRRVVEDEEILVKISPRPLLRGPAAPGCQGPGRSLLHRRARRQTAYHCVRRRLGGRPPGPAGRAGIPGRDDGVIHTNTQPRDLGSGKARPSSQDTPQ